MQVLLTGVAGFIGSHVAEALLRRGDRVTGVDNLDDFYDPARKKRNLVAVEAADSGGQFDFVMGDVRDQALVDRLFHDQRFDAVAHLAAKAGVRVSIEDPELYYDVNLKGTLYLLDGARRAETPPNFVFASTSSAYGNTTHIPFIETDSCDRPLAPYPASKRAAELLGHTYHYIYGLDFTALRFFTVYGPRGRPDMMAFKVADNIQHGTEVPLFNDGRMHRDWTFIDDIVNGITAALDRRLGYEIINLGRGEAVLLADFVQLIERELGQPAQFITSPMPTGDVSYTAADISKAIRLLGYEPRVSAAEGIAAFIAWYRQDVLGEA